jgi:hypothetical protein
MKLYPTPPTGLYLDYVLHWGEPAWTEIFSTTSTEIHLAGICLDGVPAGNISFEVEFAIGAVGEEYTIHTYRTELRNVVNSTRMTIEFEVPLGGIPSGVRLSMRGRGYAPTFLPSTPFQILYYENFTSGHKSSGEARCFPYHGDIAHLGGISVAWPDSWTNSAWQEITPGEDVEITLTSIWWQPTITHQCPAELDIAKGPDGIAHANILTTKRFLHCPFNGMYAKIILPGGFPVPADTRLVFRIRRSVVNGAAGPSLFSFNYIRETRFLY